MKHSLVTTAAAAALTLIVAALVFMGSAQAVSSASMDSAADRGKSQWVGLDSGDFNHACVLRSGNTAWCWGWNGERNLGLGKKEIITRPTRLDGRDWTEVTTERGTSCGLKEDATVWCWGRLRGSDKKPSLEPVQTPMPAVEHISVGSNGVCGTNANHEAWCVVLYVEDDELPDSVQLPGAWRSVEVGSGYICGVQTSTHVACLGDAAFGGGNYYPGDEDGTTPTVIGSRRGFRSVSVADFSMNACAVHRKGGLWCWGDNSWGRLGDGTRGGKFHREPSRIGPRNTHFVSVSEGSEQGCAIDTKGRMWCWGHNAAGGVGDGTRNMRKRPVRVESSIRWREVSAQDHSTYAIAASGRLFAWGFNYRSALGVDPRAGVHITGDNRAVLTPLPVLRHR